MSGWSPALRHMVNAVSRRSSSANERSLLSQFHSLMAAIISLLAQFISLLRCVGKSTCIALKMHSYYHVKF